ncbi:hypothetical protein LWI29_005159 [Acer saccharum]|uniref:Uncharacterized protein n=1 Tax=Acer saccharum TaxID=4024 RepID=A0AA39TI70_ACESA|nr:hypothetical protein LWI29_005159 [Acer saccharum]
MKEALFNFTGYLRVGSGFTNTANSPFVVSREEPSEEGDEYIEAIRSEGDRADMISLARGPMLFMLDGFGCIPDSTSTKDTIAMDHNRYGIPLNVLMSLPIKGKEIFKASKALVPKEKEVSVLNKEEVVVAFKRRRLGEGWDRDHILATVEKMEVEAAVGHGLALVLTDGISSSNDPSKGGAIKKVE